MTEIANHSLPPMMVASAPPGEDGEGAGIKPRAVIHALRRRWKFALPLGLCLAVIGAIAGWSLMVPKHLASAYLRVDASDRPLIFETADHATGGGTPYDLYKATQSQLLVTPFVLNAALRDETVANLPVIQSKPDPITWLQEELKVAFPSQSEIMKVSLETESPTDCVKLINAVVAAYMDNVVDNDREARIKRLQDLEKVYAVAEAKVRNTRANLRSLAETVGTGDSESLTVAQQTALEQYGMMQDKLISVQLQQMELEDEMTIAKQIAEQRRAAEPRSNDGADDNADQETADQQSVSDGSTSDGSASEAAIAPPRTQDILRLEEEINRLESQLSTTGIFYGSQHPVYVEFDQRLQATRKLLEMRISEQAGRRNDAAPMVALSNTGAMFDPLLATAKLDSLKRQEKILQAKVDEFEVEFRQLGQSSIEVELMRSEIQAQQDILRRVGAEIERTDIEQDRAPRIQVMSPAESASPPEMKKRLAATGALGMFGFCVPFVLLVGWDLTRSSVDDAESVSTALAVTNMGTIPKISGDPLGKTTLRGRRRYERQRLLLQESIASVATLVLQYARRADRQVFMVTSALPGEGKSTVACQLAESLAKSGKKVALVDFDLRRPSIDRYLQLQPAPGVSEVLHEKAELKDALQENDTPNLSVVAAGAEGVSLYERSSSHALENLFDDLRQGFDLVVVDACPVLPIVDARIIGTYCDGAILTLIRDRSRLPAASRACDMLKEYGVAILGTVVIGDTSSFYSSRKEQYDYEEKRQPNRDSVISASIN